MQRREGEAGREDKEGRGVKTKEEEVRSGNKRMSAEEEEEEM